MLSYNDAKSIFERARNQIKGAPWGYATRIVRTNMGYGVKHHDTVILEICRENNLDVYYYNTKGWRSRTTKDRLNKYGPLRIFQQKGVWYVNLDGSDAGYGETRVGYHDGLRYAVEPKSALERLMESQQAAS